GPGEGPARGVGEAELAPALLDAHAGPAVAVLGDRGEEAVGLVHGVEAGRLPAVHAARRELGLDDRPAHRGEDREVGEELDQGEAALGRAAPGAAGHGRKSVVSFTLPPPASFPGSRQVTVTTASRKPP